MLFEVIRQIISSQKRIPYELQYYIFEELNDVLLSITLKIKPSIPTETVERLNSFLTKVFQIQVYKKTVFGFMEDEENKKMVYFSSDQLRNLLTNDYNLFLEELESHGIIEIVENYFKYGKYYKLMVLTGQALNSNRITTSITFKRVRTGLRNYYRSKYNKLTGIDKEVFNNIWRLKFKINEAEIREELKTRYPKYLKERSEYINDIATATEKKKGLTVMSVEEYINQSRFYHDYITMWNESTKIEKASFVSIDSFGNRFHSIFTTMPSFFRQYVKLDNSEDIVALDLAQSQPTLLAKILHDEIGDNEFTGAVNSGDVYSSYPYQRSNAKKQFLRSIFSNRYSGSYLELSRTFPSLAQFILELQNMKMYRDGERIESYKNTSCLLQRFESRIFRIIWEKLLKSGVQFINVHDGVYVAAHKKEEAKKIMESVLRKELSGIKFKIN